MLCHAPWLAVELVTSGGFSQAAQASRLEFVCGAGVLVRPCAARHRRDLPGLLKHHRGAARNRIRRMPHPLEIEQVPRISRMLSSFRLRPVALHFAGLRNHRPERDTRNIAVERLER